MRASLYTLASRADTKYKMERPASASRSIFSRRRLTLFSALLLLLLRLTIVAQATDLATQGGSFQKSLIGTESHCYRVALESNQYLSLSLEASNSDVEIRLYGPNSTLVREVTCREDGFMPLSIVAKERGVYRIELRSVGKSESAAIYDLKIEEVRASDTRDRYRFDAEIAFVAAEVLRREFADQARRKAISSYAQAKHLWGLAGDSRRQAVVMKLTGEVYLSLGQPQKAMDSYGNALLLSGQDKDAEIESEVLSGLTDVCLYLGRNGEAKEQALKAVAASREARDMRAEAQAFSKAGDAYYALEDFNNALSHYDQSLSLSVVAGDLRGQAQALLNLGYLHSDLSESEDAIACFDKAMRLWVATGDLRGQAFTLTARGNIYSRIGRKQEALGLYSRAKILFEQTNEKVGKAFLLNGLGHVYDGLGELRRSLDHYGDALRLFREIGYVPGIPTALWSIGGIYYLMEDYEKALSCLQESLSIMRELGSLTWESYALRSIGKVYTAQGQYKEALECFDKAISLYQSDSDPRGEAYTLNSIGALYSRQGDRKKALDYHNQALALNRKAGDHFGETATLYAIARIELDEGLIDSALVHVKSAINNIEKSRSEIDSYDLRASFLAAVRQSYELYIDALMLLAQKQQDSGLAMEALQVSEQARARALLEMINEARADIYHGIDAALVERERALQKQIHEKLENQLKLLSGDYTEEQAKEAAKELDDAIAEHRQARAQMRIASPRYSALTQPQILSGRDIQQQLLDADTALIEYALGDDRSYLWAITQDSIITRTLPSRAEIEAVARQVYEILNEPNRKISGESRLGRLQRIRRAEEEYWKASARLSEIILAPAVELLGKKRLLVIPDGALQYIPFAALPDPRSRESERGGDKLSGNSDSRLPLIIEHEIIHLPSASILSVLRREAVGRPRPSKAVAVIADPVFSKDDPRLKPNKPVSSSIGKPQTRLSARDRREGRVPRLPFSRDEADAILAAIKGRPSMIALGFEASHERVMSEDLSQFHIVHFATHGFINSERPELSEILLSLVDENGQAKDGSLRLYEIYGLRLAADLVVLSACQTALGKDVRGEGLIGLVRGFMYAGASRVVASLWSVNDAATAELMKRFYGKMVGEGLRPAEALRIAQIEMFRQNRWSNPYYWAAFSLQGDWK